jgi:hypothetical protein
VVSATAAEPSCASPVTQQTEAVVPNTIATQNRVPVTHDTGAGTPASTKKPVGKVA